MPTARSPAWHRNARKGRRRALISARFGRASARQLSVLARHHGTSVPAEAISSASMTWVKCWQCGGDHLQRDCHQWGAQVSGKSYVASSLPPPVKPAPKSKTDVTQSEVAERNSLATIKAQKQSLAKLKTPESRDAIRDLAKEEKGIKIRLSRRKDDEERLGVLEKLRPTLVSAIESRKQEVSRVQARVQELESEVSDNDAEATMLRARIEKARIEREQAEVEADAIDSASANVQPSFHMRDVSDQRQDDVAYLMEQNRLLHQQMQELLAQNRQLLQTPPPAQSCVSPSSGPQGEPVTPVGQKPSLSTVSESPMVPEMPSFGNGAASSPSVSQDPYGPVPASQEEWPSDHVDATMDVPDGFSDGLSDGCEAGKGFQSSEETPDGILGGGLRALGVKKDARGAGRRSPPRPAQRSMQPFSRSGGSAAVKKKADAGHK